MIIQENVLLSEKTWFRTGGMAQWYSEPRTAQDFAEALEYAARHEFPITVLGEGANVLVSDEGIAGLVIRPSVNYIFHEQLTEHAVQVTAGAGVSFPDLIQYCLAHQLVGLEEFSGIPGTVGGSVFINIHYFHWLLSQFLVKAQVIDRTTGELLSVGTDWFNFGYNQSRLHTGTHYLVDATFAVAVVDREEAAYARGRSYEIIRHRKQRYPYERTCGSFFRNFTSDEVSGVSMAKPVIYVAYYIEQLGIKGQLSVGGAHLSHQHANMIVTKPGATSNDVIMLAQKVQRLVYERYSIMPKPECQMLGFPQNPLLSVNAYSSVL